jgi:hypothetical protein
VPLGDTIDLEEWFEDLIELVQPLRPTLLRLTLDHAAGHLRRRLSTSPPATCC